MLFFAEDILLIFAQPEYIAGAVSMKILAAASLLYGLSYIVFSVLYSIGSPKKSRDLNLIGGVSNTALSVITIPTLGMFGAAISYLLSSLIIFLLSVFWSKKDLKINPAPKFSLPSQGRARERSGQMRL